MTNIIAAPWKNTYSVFGIDTEGQVWRLDRGKDCSGWIPQMMEEAASSYLHKESKNYKPTEAKPKTIKSDFKLALSLPNTTTVPQLGLTFKEENETKIKVRALQEKVRGKNKAPKVLPRGV